MNPDKAKQKIEEKRMPRGTNAYASYAILFLMASRGETQAELAQSMGIHRPTISHLIAGRRGWAAEYIDAASAFWKLEPDELLNIGRQVYDGQEVFPYLADVREFPLHSEARLTKIFKLAARGNNALEALVSADMIKREAAPVYEAYLKGDFTDGQMFVALQGLVGQLEKDPDAEWYAFFNYLPPGFIK